MKAVRIQKREGFEGTEGLVYEDAPDPQLAIGDALETDRAGHDRGPRIPVQRTWPCELSSAGSSGQLGGVTRSLPPRDCQKSNDSWRHSGLKTSGGSQRVSEGQSRRAVLTLH